MAVIATIQTTMQSRQSTFSGTARLCGIRALSMKSVSPDVSSIVVRLKRFSS